MLRNKCITGVLLNIIPQVIVGKYSTSSVSSRLMNRDNIIHVYIMCWLKLAIIGFYCTCHLII